MKEIEKINLFMQHLVVANIIKNQKEFGRSLGYYNTSSFSQLLKKESASKKLVTKLKEVYPDYENWEVGGSILLGNMPVKNEVRFMSRDEFGEVKFVPMTVSAGVLGGTSTIDESREFENRTVPKKYARGKHLAIEVQGDSMNDGTIRSICEGDEILIYKWDENLRYLPIANKVFVVMTKEDGPVLKQILLVDEKRRVIRLHSFNNTYRDFEIRFEDILDVYVVEKKICSDVFI